MNEADTCLMLVRPKLETAGWDGDKHFYSEQTAFTDGRIIVPGGKPRRLKKKYSDFLLRYTRDITLAVVEAKSDKKPAGNGLQQADRLDTLRARVWEAGSKQAQVAEELDAFLSAILDRAFRGEV